MHRSILFVRPGTKSMSTPSHHPLGMTQWHILWRLEMSIALLKPRRPSSREKHSRLETVIMDTWMGSHRLHLSLMVGPGNGPEKTTMLFPVCHFEPWWTRDKSICKADRRSWPDRFLSQRNKMWPRLICLKGYDPRYPVMHKEYQVIGQLILVGAELIWTFA